MLQNHFQVQYERFRRNWSRLAAYHAKMATRNRIARIRENIVEQAYWWHIRRMIKRMAQVKLL